MADTDQTYVFDPARYLTKVSGSDYLEVKWRLLWLRLEHPEAIIETELHTLDGQMAIFKATVSLPGPAGSATGWGSEQYGDFRDYIEKAETKAIGRALAALGYGTQFCRDHEFGSDEGRVVDSPINFQARGQSRGGGDQGEGNRSGQPATTKQLQFISSIARELGLSDESLHLEAQSSFGSSIEDLTRRDASVMIERLQQRRQQSSRPIGSIGGR